MSGYIILAQNQLYDFEDENRLMQIHLKSTWHIMFYILEAHKVFHFEFIT